MLGEEPGVRGGTRCYGRNQVLGEERRGRIVQETKLKVHRNQANDVQAVLLFRRKIKTHFGTNSLKDRNNNKVSKTAQL